MLEKIDIRCKFDPVSIAFVEAEAAARGVDKCIVLREILDQWAETKKRAYREAHRFLRAKGLDGELEGSAGQSGASEGKAGLVWEDED